MSNLIESSIIKLPFVVNEVEMEIEVRKLNTFSILQSIADQDFLDNQPGVYVFYDKKQLYIGESSHPYKRLKQHMTSKKLDPKFQVLVFRSNKFNKSAIYDIETKLIDYFNSEKKFKLINDKVNQGKHSYFMQEFYEAAVDKIWQFLLDEGISKYKIQDIEKLNIFKFSPFKDLNSEQQMVIEDVTEEKPKVTLIKGYPGTGKSILASVLYNTISIKEDVALVAGTKPVHEAFREVFKTIDKNKKTKSVVSRAKDIINSDKMYECIIIDEAHRLLRKGGKGMGAKYMHLGPGENELDELAKKTKRLVILYDENQVVHDGDFIFQEEKYNLGSKVYYLKEQMRASGGYKFVNYFVSTFNNIESIYEPSDNYEVKIFKSFSKMYDELKNKAKKYELVRLLSGYSRQWKSKDGKYDGERPYDFEIDGINLRWNSKSEKWINSLPAKNLEEVAYYTTVQGFDLTYAGVIIGRDVRLNEQGNIAVDEEHIPKSAINQKPSKKDPLYQQKLHNWTMNRYKVLLSRASKGTYIYCEDEKLLDKLLRELK